MKLPDKPRSRHGRSALQSRVLLAGTPKVGKSTLLSKWAPEQTLIVDTHNGTTLLEGEHYVEDVSTWTEFVALVDALVKPGHRFKVVGIDLIDDVWTMVDKHYAGRGAPAATATDDYSRSAKAAEAAFKQEVGRLLATDLGVWFVTHTREIEDKGTRFHKPKLDSRVETFVKGACDFVFLAERLGPKRRLHTSPSESFEAGTRVPLPETMDLDASKLYRAMKAGLEPAKQTDDKREAVTA